MKKMYMVFLAALLVAALFLAGCGSGGSSGGKQSPDKAEDLLKSSQAKMEDVKAVKLKGTANVNTPGAETKTEKVDFEVAVNSPSKEDISMHMVSKESTGKTTEMYVVNGWAYSNDPTTGWSKTKYQGSGGLSSGVITPGSISDMTKYAKQLKLGPEEAGKYVISFNIGSDFIDQLFDQAMGQSTAPTEQDEATKQLVQTMKDMLKGIEMGMVYKIDKKTLLGDQVEVKMSMKSAPALGDVSVDMTANLYDYNVPVAITLPPEAQNAPEKQVGPGGIPNIPSIPGLGM